MVLQIADVINMGLRAGGLPLRISEVYEGSEAARVSLEIYGQARDELLRTQDWSFSRRIVSLTLLKGPPPDGGYNPAQPWSNVYPIPGFLYEYSYPSDCLDLRAITQPPGGMPDLDPVPALWRIDNDPFPVVSGTPPVASGPQAKVILCNMTDAIAVYRAQITDVNLWEPLFTASLVASLGKKFAKAFAATAQETAQNSAETVATVRAGGEVRG